MREKISFEGGEDFISIFFNGQHGIGWWEVFAEHRMSKIPHRYQYFLQCEQFQILWVFSVVETGIMDEDGFCSSYDFEHQFLLLKLNQPISMGIISNSWKQVFDEKPIFIPESQLLHSEIKLQIYSLRCISQWPVSELAVCKHHSCLINENCFAIIFTFNNLTNQFEIEKNLLFSDLPSPDPIRRRRNAIYDDYGFDEQLEIVKNNLPTDDFRLIVMNLNLFCLEQAEARFKKHLPCQFECNMNRITFMMIYKPNKLSFYMEVAKKNLLKTIFGYSEIKISNVEQLNSHTIFGLLLGRCLFPAGIPSRFPWLLLRARLDLPVSAR